MLFVCLFVRSGQFPPWLPWTLFLLWSGVVCNLNTFVRWSGCCATESGYTQTQCRLCLSVAWWILCLVVNLVNPEKFWGNQRFVQSAQLEHTTAFPKKSIQLQDWKACLTGLTHVFYSEANFDSRWVTHIESIRMLSIMHRKRTYILGVISGQLQRSDSTGCLTLWCCGCWQRPDTILNSFTGLSVNTPQNRTDSGFFFAVFPCFFLGGGGYIFSFNFSIIKTFTFSFCPDATCSSPHLCHFLFLFNLPCCFYLHYFHKSATPVVGRDWGLTQRWLKNQDTFVEQHVALPRWLTPKTRRTVNWVITERQL